MSRSAAGTTEQPGRNVRAKSGLNKSILDQGWFEFRRQLDYKLAWAGGHLIVVPPQNTSRTCPACGHVSADNRQTQARFLCVECGFEENADLVGAINILRAGHAHCACEVSGAAMPPAAGTHRSDSFRLDAGVGAVGIPGLQGGEDVKYPGPRQAAREWHTQRIHREIAAIEAAGLTVESTIGEILDAGVELDG